MIALDICTSAHPVKNFLPIEIFVKMSYLIDLFHKISNI